MRQGWLRRCARGVHWYLREVSGEADYDRYLEHHRRRHPARNPLTPAEFQRYRWQHRAEHPSSGCC